MLCSRELLRRQDSCDQWLLTSSHSVPSGRSPLFTLAMHVTFLPYSSSSSPPDRTLHFTLQFILGAPFLQCVLGFAEYVHTERHWLRLWMKFPTRSLHHHISNTRPICIVDWSLIVGNVLVAHFQLTALTSCVTTEQTRSTTGQWPDQSTQRQASCRFIKNLFSFLFILAHYEVKENYHKEVA